MVGGGALVLQQSGKKLPESRSWTIVFIAPRIRKQNFGHCKYSFQETK